MSSAFAFDDKRSTQIQDRWGDSLGGGFLVTPSVLFRHQAELDLDCEEVVVLSNLVLHWWSDEQMPFPRSESLARRTGLSRRTVQRRIRQLEEKGFLKRVWLHRDDEERAVAHYDMHGTVARLAPFGQKAREERELNALRKGGAQHGRAGLQEG